MLSPKRRLSFFTSVLIIFNFPHAQFILNLSSNPSTLIPLIIVCRVPNPSSVPQMLPYSIIKLATLINISCLLPGVMVLLPPPTSQRAVTLFSHWPKMHVFCSLHCPCYRNLVAWPIFYSRRWGVCIYIKTTFSFYSISFDSLPSKNSLGIALSSKKHRRIHLDLTYRLHYLPLFSEIIQVLLSSKTLTSLLIWTIFGGDFLDSSGWPH